MPADFRCGITSGPFAMSLAGGPDEAAAKTSTQFNSSNRLFADP